jgi:sacsin
LVLVPLGSKDVPHAPPEDQGSDYTVVIATLKKQLKDAWGLPEDQRKRVTRRLQFQWHPDKNPQNAAFCTRIFQRLQNLVEMLERGNDIDGEDVLFDQTSSATGKYYDFMRERARSYHSHEQQWRQSHSKRRRNKFNSSNHTNDNRYDEFFSDFRTAANPQPGEAKRWIRQANYDLQAANGEVAHEWICYKCHQAAEKAIRAARYAKDANCNHLKSKIDNLRQLAENCGVDELNDIATQLETLLHDTSYLRYPASHEFPHTPHDVIDPQTSTTAVELSTRIVVLCQKYIDDNP